VLVAWFETPLRHTRGGTEENYNNIHYNISEIGNTCLMNTILVAGNSQVPELILCSYLHIGSLLADSSNPARCAHAPFQTVRIRDDSFLFLSLTSIPRFETQPPICTSQFCQNKPERSTSSNDGTWSLTPRRNIVQSSH